AELKLTGLLAEHNVSLRFIDTLGALCTNIFPNSTIAKGINLHRTKATTILKNVLGNSFLEDINDTLGAEGNFFSLVMDETTDQSTIKQCCFTAIMYNNENNKVETVFLDMVEVESGTASGLHECLKDMLKKKHIPINNMVGFSSDTTNVMAGDMLNPSIAQQFEIQSIARVFQRFPILNNFVTRQKVDDEWRAHAMLNHAQYGLNTNDYDSEENYWAKVFSLKNSAGQFLFSNLKHVLSLLLVLPFSNASVERKFSVLRNLKTENRNRLHTDTVVALMATREDFTGVLQYEADTHEPTPSHSPEETNIATTSLYLNASVDSSKINIISNLVVVPSKDKDINVKEFIAGLLSLLLDNVLDKEERCEKGKLAKTKKINVKTTDDVSNKASSSEGKMRMTSLAKPKRAKNNCSSDSDINLTEDCELECLLDDEEIAIGNFILVKFSTTKKIVHYVGCIQDTTEKEEPIDDISVVFRKDIVAKLPKPKQVG
ncbi:hypothetical protein NQ314_017045, partial [Rhamnusium bicolor]